MQWERFSAGDFYLMAFVAYDASAYPWMLCICNDLYMAHRHYSFVYVRNLWRRGKGVEEFRRGAIAGYVL